MDQVYRGLAGGKGSGGSGAGGKAKAGQNNHLDSSSSAVPSVWDLYWYNPQGGPWLPLRVVMSLRAEKCILMVQQHW